MHTQQVSYFAMHQWIYDHYTGGRYDGTGGAELDQPYEVEAGLLWPSLPPSEHALRRRGGTRVRGGGSGSDSARGLGLSLGVP